MVVLERGTEKEEKIIDKEQVQKIAITQATSTRDNLLGTRVRDPITLCNRYSELYTTQLDDDDDDDEKQQQHTDSNNSGNDNHGDHIVDK